MEQERIYQKQLLERLSKSLDLQNEKELFRSLFGNALLWIVDKESGLALQTQNAKRKIGQKQIVEICSLQESAHCPSECKFLRSSKKKECLRCLSGILKQAKNTKKVEKFVCSKNFFGLCFPLAQGDAFYGFLILCNLKNSPSRESQRLFEALNETILEKVQKELELSKLYETIRPRAIALSTIHTIHRLISSSLDLNELIPRIARLSLQVLRAKKCLISLVDEKTKRLVPKAMIDISKKKSRVSAFKKRIQKRVLRSGITLLKKNYLSVPLIDEEPVGVISVYAKMTNGEFNNFDREILTALAEQATGAIKNAKLYKEQEDMLSNTVKFVSTLLKLKSGAPYTHSKHVIDIIMGIAKELHLSEEELRNLRYAAMLHDAEKIGIPEEILKKPTFLTEREYNIVKKHPKKSAKILKPMQRLKPAVGIMVHHHEKFDGSGYPDKLKGEAIPLGSRIMAVADTLEAMISRRPYRKSTPIAQAIQELKSKSGTQFDPRVIKAFVKLAKRKSFKKLLKELQNG
ncbi:MAG: HD-GYP domain-containing protein [Candidatus Omnitrophica bacterium]|nr:HD-GYP domain-containing protein [Candidatus Omnitrophota bacterium]